MKLKNYSSGITIGLIPEVNIFEQKKRYEPLMRYLSRHLEMNVSSLVTGHYGSLLGAFKESKIDAAVHGSLNFAFLDRFVGVEPLARPLWKNNVSTYAGYIVTRHDSGLSADVSKWGGKRLSLVSRSTTAGFVFPVDYIHKHGVDDIESYFAEIIFTGSHDASLLAVYNGTADIGAGKNHIFNKLAEKNPDFKGSMLVVAVSKEVPSNTFSASKRLSPKTRARLKQVLIEMNDNPEGRAVLDNFGAQRFLPTVKADFDPVFDMVRSAKIDLEDPLYAGQ
ncbi:MAG: phosphate/phosphite/phosphonate ABC transporter substrate-binding protein [Proteobacteria bacterium]|nr:phosphate/phosphite/phosphonate ABC transporter substrate-binding protein [Pseudomonadota bacterium]